MTKKKNLVLALCAAGILIAAGGGLFWAGMQHGMHAAVPAMTGSGVATSGAKIDPVTGKKVL